MKIIEALKKIKELNKKCSDYKELVKKNCSISSFDTPEYGDKQAIKIKEWIQGHSDLLKEILRLRIAIQKTNLSTEVTIELEGKQVTKTIAEWIHRRRDLANEELSMWSSLTDRGIREGIVTTPSGEKTEVKIKRFFDPEQRDNKKALYDAEPTIIDSKLEVINAVTDIIE